MNIFLRSISIIVLLVAVTTNVVAEGRCTYNTTTIIEDGQVISKKEIQVCDEVQPIGKVSLLTKEEKMQMFETGLILTFLFILENM